MEKNRTCVICRKKYSYCPTCTSDLDKPTWYTIFHNDNCRKIYEICTLYNTKKINLEDAKKQLNECDISDFDNYTISTKNVINEILGKADITKKDVDSINNYTDNDTNNTKETKSEIKKTDKNVENETAKIRKKFEKINAMKK